MKVEYEFDPFDIAGVDVSSISSAQRKQILDEIKALVLENVLLDVADQRSPVTGRTFKGLNPQYKIQKELEGGTGVANLLLSGDLLDSLVVKSAGGSKLLLTVSEDQMGKADGHCNFSGESQLPRRPFIPDESNGETFRPAIRSQIREVIDSILAGE